MDKTISLGAGCMPARRVGLGEFDLDGVQQEFDLYGEYGELDSVQGSEMGSDEEYEQEEEMMDEDEVEQPVALKKAPVYAPLVPTQNVVMSLKQCVRNYPNDTRLFKCEQQFTNPALDIMTMGVEREHIYNAVIALTRLQPQVIRDIAYQIEELSFKVPLQSFLDLFAQTVDAGLQLVGQKRQSGIFLNPCFFPNYNKAHTSPQLNTVVCAVDTVTPSYFLNHYWTDYSMQVPEGVDGLKLYPLWHVLHEPESVPHIDISVKELWGMLLDTSMVNVSFEDVDDANAANHEVFRKLTISGIKVMQSITCMKENTLSLDERFKMRTFINSMNRYDFSEQFYYKIVPLTGVVNTVGNGGIWVCVPVSEGEEDSSRVETKTSFIVAQNPMCDTPIALLPIDLLRKPSYYQAANRTNTKETSTEKIWSAMQQPTQYIATEFDSGPDKSCLYQYSHWMVHLMYYLCDGNSAFELGPTDKDLMFPMARCCWKKVHG